MTIKSIQGKVDVIYWRYIDVCISSMGNIIPEYLSVATEKPRQRDLLAMTSRPSDFTIMYEKPAQCLVLPNRVKTAIIQSQLHGLQQYTKQQPRTKQRKNSKM